MNEQKPYAPIHAVPDKQEALSESLGLEVSQDALTMLLGDNSQTMLDKLTDEMESTAWLCKQVTPLLFEKDQNEFLKQARIAQKALRSISRNLDKLELQIVTEFPKLGYIQLFILMTGYIFGGKITPERLMQIWSAKSITKAMDTRIVSLKKQADELQERLSNTICDCKEVTIKTRYDKIWEEKFQKLFPKSLEEDICWAEYIVNVSPGLYQWRHGENLLARKTRLEIKNEFLELYKKYLNKKPPVDNPEWSVIYSISLEVVKAMNDLAQNYNKQMEKAKEAIHLEVEKEMDID